MSINNDEIPPSPTPLVVEKEGPIFVSKAWKNFFAIEGLLLLLAFAVPAFSAGLSYAVRDSHAGDTALSGLFVLLATLISAGVAIIAGIVGFVGSLIYILRYSPQGLSAAAAWGLIAAPIILVWLIFLVF